MSHARSPDRRRRGSRTPGRRLPTADDAARLTSLLSMMADPVRLRLIYALDVVEELCVGDLALRSGRQRGRGLLRVAAAARGRSGRHPPARAGSSTTGWRRTSPRRCAITACVSWSPWSARSPHD